MDLSDRDLLTIWPQTPSNLIPPLSAPTSSQQLSSICSGRTLISTLGFPSLCHPNTSCQLFHRGSGTILTVSSPPKPLWSPTWTTVSSSTQVFVLPFVFQGLSDVPPTGQSHSAVMVDTFLVQVLSQVLHMLRVQPSGQLMIVVLLPPFSQ